MNLSDFLPTGGLDHQVMIITSSGTFTVPEGVYTLLVSMIGGGGSGAAYYGSTSSRSHGGWSGAGTIRKPFSVTPLQEITATIGAGGAAVTLTSSGSISNGNNGGNTTFIETVSGGAGGKATATSTGLFLPDNAVLVPTHCRFSAKANAGFNFRTHPPNGQDALNQVESCSVGRTFQFGVSSSSSSVCRATGGAGSPFAKGGDAASTGGAAESGSYGSGGGGHTYVTAISGQTVTSGAGGNGVIIVEWEGPEATFV